MIAFDMDGKVRKPKFELDSEQVRYEHRFAPFNSVITPPPVHYLQFKVNHINPCYFHTLIFLKKMSQILYFHLCKQLFLVVYISLPWNEGKIQ